MFKKLYWNCFIVYLSLKWCRQINLGDLVWYEGKKHIVLNGTMTNHWRISDVTSNSGWVLCSKCKKVWTLSNIIKSYCSGRRFYMINWYKIWINEGIKPWMLNCNIWAKNNK